MIAVDDARRAQLLLARLDAVEAAYGASLNADGLRLLRWARFSWWLDLREAGALWALDEARLRVVVG